MPAPYPGGLTPDRAALVTFTYCSNEVFEAFQEQGVKDFSNSFHIEELDDDQQPEIPPDAPALAESAFKGPVGQVHEVSLTMIVEGGDVGTKALAYHILG